MRNQLFVVLTILLIGLIFSCENKKTENKTLVEVPKKPVRKIVKIHPSLIDSLQSHFKNNFPTASDLKSIYNSNRWKSFWQDAYRKEKVIMVLSEAQLDGLKSEDYLPLFLKNKLQSSEIISDTADVLLTHFYLNYLHDIHFGKIDPAKIFTDFDIQREHEFKGDSGLFVRLLTASPVLIVDSLRPNYPLYGALRRTLAEWYQKKIPIFVDTLKYPGKVLSINDTSVLIPLVKKRLFTLGIIEENDTNTIFTDALEEAIIEFQRKTKLEQTGKLDRFTLKRMNFTSQELKDMVCANMERCRWLIKGMEPEKYILINVADFSLRYIQDGTSVFETRIIVGKEQNETPVFHSEIYGLQINPDWTVPQKISRKEILPELKKDSTYLARNKMVLMQKNKVVNKNDFSSYTENYFPYVIKQLPGNENALGKIKFLLNSPYDIYLHDTPGKYLFARNQRTFSHGCIRVEHPFLLAEYILKEQGVRQSDFEKWKSKDETVHVRIKPRLPVMITYWTCVLDDEASLVFYKDIYGRDKKIIRQLNLNVH